MLIYSCSKYFSIAALLISAALSHGMESGQTTQNNALVRINVITNHLVSQPKKAGLGDRPAHIQAAVDSAFEGNKNADENSWRYNGSWGYYTLVDLDEDALFKQLAYENSGEKNVYIIDAGCAQGKWGRNALHILKDEYIKKSGKRFHIFSVTGGKECDELVEHKDHVILYQFNHFKIENIDEEFTKRGFDLKNKVNLIVSHWTLRHLVDPFGTVKRMYDLLNPKQGKLMSNGFLFKFNDTDEIQAFPMYNENILIASNALCLFKAHTVGRDTGQFLLMRNDYNELNIPLEYTGETHGLGWGYQCVSEKVTVFNKGHLIEPNKDLPFETRFTIDDGCVYYPKDDHRSKDLYNALLNQKLFCRKTNGFYELKTKKM